MVALIKITTKGMNRVITKLNKKQRTIPIGGISAVRDYSDILIKRMQSIIQAEIRYPEESTGQLVGGFSKSETERGISIHNSAPHAKWVDRGASPHMISGKSGNKLAWNRYGKWNTAWTVSHPGIVNPMRFSERAVEQTKRSIIEIMKRKLKT